MEGQSVDDSGQDSGQQSEEDVFHSALELQCLNESTPEKKPVTDEGGSVLVELGQSTSPHKSWLSLFNELDSDGKGFIHVDDLHALLDRSDATGLDPGQLKGLLAAAEKSKRRCFDFEEFCFMIAKARKMRMLFMMFCSAHMAVPKQGRRQAFDAIQQNRFIRMPVFMLFISIAQIAAYVYYAVSMQASEPVPLNSTLIFNPYRRHEAWRFVTPMFIHIGIAHIVFNVLNQLLLGIDLELVYNVFRVALVYLSGVVAGSLAASVCNPTRYGAGASGGVYSLLAVHLTILIVNWRDLHRGKRRIIAMAIGGAFDIALGLVIEFATPWRGRISHVAHLGGLIAGVAVGILVLRVCRFRAWERPVWWATLVMFLGLVGFCVLWNIFAVGQYPTSRFD